MCAFSNTVGRGPALYAALWSLLLALPASSSALPEAGLLRGSQSSAEADVAGSHRLSWEDAKKKANETLWDPTLRELYDLVRGSNFSGDTGDPDRGYYTGNILGIPRLGVPALKMQDAAQGFRPSTKGAEGTTTAWPCLLALASAWDEGLAGELGAAIAREFRGKGANVILGPSVNVHRVARNGRNFEYLSGEDPYLGSRLTAAYVGAVQSGGVMATVKHFAFNQQETHRMEQDSVVDARTAWELYYPPFEAAVDAGVGAFMCSYNKVNGTYACGNSDLLKRDLQGAMGFKGFVMSDWGATHNTSEIEDGLQVEMPGIIAFNGTEYGYFQDSLLRHINLQAVREAGLRVLTSIYHLGLDKDGGCELPCVAELLSDQTSANHRRLARKVATRAVTLLKNDDVLPLNSSRVKTLAVIGSAADAAPAPGGAGDYYSGGGSGKVFSKSVVTPLQGIKKRAQAAGVSVITPADNSTAAAIAAARDADIVIVVVATTAHEGSDRSSLSLDDGADALISAVAKKKPTVVLMQTPGAVLTPWRHEVKAVANLFLAGEETGSAWAAVLFGDASPSGKLPIMMPASVADTISPSDNMTVLYSEGVFTSYRSPTFRAAFPFGHGLSYGRFGYGRSEQVFGGACAAAACIRLKVHNWGTHAASEVVQAYVRFPGDASQPRQVLKGFRRTRELRNGQSEEVLFRLSARDLSVYKAGGWHRPSKVQVAVGSSSADIREVLDLEGPA